MSGAVARAAGLLALVALLALIALAVTTSRPTHASVFTVDTTADAVDASPGDGACATAAGHCSLRAAVQESNAHPGGDVISLPAGTFLLTIGGTGEGEAAAGDLDITGDLTITGASSQDSVVSAGFIDRVFDLSPEADVHFSDFAITEGNADIDGGAVINRGTMTLEGMRIVNNMARDGGGLYNNGTMSVVGSTVVDNTSRDSGAGIQNDGVLNVSRTSIVHNRASHGGGGVNSLNTLKMNDSALINNDAGDERGGALSNSAAATLTNVTVSGNRAGYSGGGIVNFDHLALNNVTVANNEGGFLQAVIDNYPVSVVVFTNTIVAGNLATSCRNAGTLTSNGHNLEDGDTCGFGSAGDLINASPGLGPLADNGGPTQTHALLPGSAAINAAAGCPPADQRGYSRVGVCDIGAFEFGGLPPAPTATRTPTVTGTPPTPAHTATRTPTRTPTAHGTVVPGTPTGDANCDGQVNSIDASLIVQYVAGLLSPHGLSIFWSCNGADANGDGDVGVIDATLILQFSAGLLHRLPP